MATSTGAISGIPVTYIIKSIKNLNMQLCRHSSKTSQSMPVDTLANAIFPTAKYNLNYQHYEAFYKTRYKQNKIKLPTLDRAAYMTRELAVVTCWNINGTLPTRLRLRYDYVFCRSKIRLLNV